MSEAAKTRQIAAEAAAARVDAVVAPLVEHIASLEARIAQLESGTSAKAQATRKVGEPSERPAARAQAGTARGSGKATGK